MRKYLPVNPTHWLYIVSNALLIAVGFLVASFSHPLMSGIGASIVAAGVTGEVVFVYVRFSQGVSDRLALLTKFGFVNAFEARAARIRSEYEERLNNAHEHVDILGFGLRALREDFEDDFIRWKQRAHVRILVLDPEFPNENASYATQRDREERNSSGTIRTDVRQFIQATRDLIASDGQHRFEVRLYTCLPSVNIFRVDDELFWGPYLMREQSRNAPTFIVHRGGLLFQKLMNHFECIWNDDGLSRPVPGSWLGDEQ